MNTEITELIEKIIGMQCSRKEVGRCRSLSLGFGVEGGVSNISKTAYREWEIGTYYSAWRFVRDGIVICGSQDVVDSIDELNRAIGQVDLGRLRSLRQLTDLDVRIEFDSGVAVDIFATTSDEDECFHIFCPEERVIQFSVRDGWKAGPSDKPWAISVTGV